MPRACWKSLKLTKGSPILPLIAVVIKFVFARFAISALPHIVASFFCWYHFSLCTITKRVWKVKLKAGVKAYLLAPSLFVFVFHSRIWFASKRDPPTCFSSLYNMTWWTGVFSKKGKILAFVWWWWSKFKEKQNEETDLPLFKHRVYIEDIIWPHGHGKILFECWKNFHSFAIFFQHEKRNFVSPSDHVMFYLLYKHQWNTNHFTYK